MGRRPSLRRSLAHNTATRAADLQADARAEQPAEASSRLGLLIAATHSGAGKTVTTLALLAALRRRGLRVQAGKAGPDFIDPTHHARITGRPSCNLDTWMGGEAALPRILDACCADTPDAVIIEGVMGLHDGAGQGAGSSADVARVLDVPVLLLIDVRGMAQSVAAVAEGFLQHCPRGAEGELLPPPRFAGIVCTHVGGPAHAAMLREACAELPVPLLGMLPREGAPRIESRHLGLLMADETDFSPEHVNAMADWLEQNLDVDALLARMQAMPMRPCARPEQKNAYTARTRAGQGRRTACARTPAADSQGGDCSAGMPEQVTHIVQDGIGEHSNARPAALPEKATRGAVFSARPRVAMARDAAFCFCYADLPALLEQCGAEPVFFSPLADSALPPDCRAVYLPGGYPELHAAALAGNAAMLDSLRRFAANGGRIHGECGGYMYLMNSLTLPDGQTFPLCGCLPLACRLEQGRAALGYREVRPWAEAEEVCSLAAPKELCPMMTPGIGRPWKAPQQVRPLPMLDDAAAARAGLASRAGRRLSDKGINRRHMPQAAATHAGRTGWRGHEFHYSRLCDIPLPPDCRPLWHVAGRTGVPLPDEGCVRGMVSGSWVHLYPAGSEEFWRQLMRGELPS